MSDAIGFLVAIVLVTALWGAAFLYAADSRDGEDWRARPRD